MKGDLIMKNSDMAIKNFVMVRDELKEFAVAYRLAHFKPLKFYIEHCKEDAIDILKQEGMI